MKKTCIASALFILSFLACKQDSQTDNTEEMKQVLEVKKEYSPYVNNYNPDPLPKNEDRPLFGDTHLHTSYSADAGLIGNALGPADAFRFAKGEVVTSSTGVKAKLKRPLDWIVIADHAEGIGVMPMVVKSDPSVLANEFGKELHDLIKEGTTESIGKAYNLWVGSKIEGTNPFTDSPEFAEKPWNEIMDACEQANDPGNFTALIGYEWSSAPNGNNLHRVVVYKDGKDKAKALIPLSADTNPDPESLWDWMESYEDETGGRLLAIPHNGNLSNGLMFADSRYATGEPINSDYAKRRARFEPLFEVTQMKGDGETHPMLSPDDEFADFETMDKTSLGGNQEKTTDMLPYEYARSAFKKGLGHEKTLGTNPFKYGLVGSTDTHTSLPTTSEDNFFGKVTQLEPTADPVRFEEVVVGRLGDEALHVYAWRTSASGLAAVWAKENTREAIFDAMERKEVYATTGTRMRVRVFAGYDFNADDLNRSDFVDHGYANGVPMGADLNANYGMTPKFIVRATKDPDGANLDRVQIIKGWIDADGQTDERIFDVAVSDNRAIDESGRCKTPVGNTVDVSEATYTNTIGDTVLTAYWEDPDFNPARNAFYYVRVLEIPTPRWTTYDAKRFGVEIPEGAPTSIQERAYTSPIWYNGNEN